MTCRLMACNTECGSWRMVTSRARSSALSPLSVSKTKAQCFSQSARISARVVVAGNKFLVAVPVGLLAVGGEEVAEPRAHIACHVFHDHGNAVGLGVGCGEELFVGELCDGGIGQALMSAQTAEHFVEIHRADVRHAEPQRK